MKTIGMTLLAFCAATVLSACGGPPCKSAAKSEPGKTPADKPVPNRLQLANAHIGSDVMYVTIAGAYGHWIKLNKGSSVSATVTSGDGTVIPWSWNTQPDSKLGPLMYIKADVENALEPINVQADIAYDGTAYLLTAEFVRDERGWWKTISQNIEPRQPQKP